MNIIKPIIGTLMLLALIVWGARKCKKETGSYKAFIKGSLGGLALAAFMLTAYWLILSEVHP